MYPESLYNSETAKLTKTHTDKRQTTTWLQTVGQST